MAKVALITGGANGIGFSVATSLSERTTPSWHVHIVDANPSAGAAAAASLPHVTFHSADVSDYSALSAVFAAVFAAETRLDFVFGNAGIVERFIFVNAATKQVDAEGEENAPPPTFPDAALKVLDVDLKSTLYNGVLGLARSVAPRLHASHNIRVNALCPGMVSTSLLSDDECVKITSSPDTWTPVSCVADAVLRVVDCGTDPERPVVDSVGKEIKVGELFGKAVECSGKNWYWRDPVPFCDETMELVIGSEVQKKFWSMEHSE